MACPRPLGQQGPEPAPSCSSHTQPGSVSRLQAYNQKPPLTRQRPRGSWVCLHAEGWFWLHPFRQSTWGVQVLLFKSVQHPGVWTAPPPPQLSGSSSFAGIPGAHSQACPQVLQAAGLLSISVGPRPGVSSHPGWGAAPPAG